MIDAPVGVHCPVCVKEGRSAPVIRVGRQALNPAWVTRALLVAIVAVGVLSGFGRESAFVQRGAFFPPLVADGEWYRFLTSIFLHNRIMHLLLNSLALWLYGGLLERELGSVRYATLFLASGIAGGALFFVLETNAAAVGASGAVFGFFGALAVAYAMSPHRRDQFRAIGGLIALNLVFQFVIPGIAWQGHIGGLLGGTALGFAAFGPGGRRRPAWIFWAAAGAVLAVCAAAVLARMATSPVL